jgi:hypothetical protein
MTQGRVLMAGVGICKQTFSLTEAGKICVLKSGYRHALTRDGAPVSLPQRFP